MGAMLLARTLASPAWPAATRVDRAHARSCLRRFRYATAASDQVRITALALALTLGNLDEPIAGSRSAADDRDRPGAQPAGRMLPVSTNR